MESVSLCHLPDGHLRLEHHLVRAETQRVEFDHEQQREVVEAGRDGRHPDHVEIADLQKLGDQESGGAQHRRRDDGAKSAGRQQSTGGVFLEPGFGQHRIGDRADHHRRGDAGARRAAEQERGSHHRAARARWLAAHHCQARNR